MKQRIVFINFVILVSIVVFALRLVSAWDEYRQQNNLVSIVNGIQTEGMGEAQLSGESIEQPQPFSDFIVISERDLFREDRRQPALVAEPQAEAPRKPPTWTKRPLLHGVTVLGGNRQAIMTLYEGKDAAAGAMKTVQMGDRVQSYNVVEIADSTVRLRWRDHDEIIDMADAQEAQSASKGGGNGTNASVKVIKVGSAPEAVQTSGSQTVDPEGSIEVAIVSGQSNQARGNQSRGSQANNSTGAVRARNDEPTGLSGTGRTTGRTTRP